MPRINRAIRRRVSPAFDPGSTRWQILMWGVALFPRGGPGFENAGEERQAWREHRDELLKAAEPGQRQFAYFKFDLGIKSDLVPIPWFEQLNILLDRELIGAEEALRIENSGRGELNPHDSDFGSIFETKAGIERHGLCEYTLRPLESAFRAAARWHGWRGRPDFAALYELRADSIHTYMEGN
jgi:hypothetical protein